MRLAWEVVRGLLFGHQTDLLWKVDSVKMMRIELRIDLLLTEVQMVQMVQMILMKRDCLVRVVELGKGQIRP